MAKDPIKKAENGTYYFRANLGYHPVTGKQIQKYRSGFSTKKEARAEYSKLILASKKVPTRIVTRPFKNTLPISTRRKCPK